MRLLALSWPTCPSDVHIIIFIYVYVQVLVRIAVGRSVGPASSTLFLTNRSYVKSAKNKNENENRLDPKSFRTREIACAKTPVPDLPCGAHAIRVPPYGKRSIRRLLCRPNRVEETKTKNNPVFLEPVESMSNSNN